MQRVLISSFAALFAASLVGCNGGTDQTTSSHGTIVPAETAYHTVQSGLKAGAGIDDCATHQPPLSPAAIESSIDPQITGADRNVMRELLSALPRGTGTHDVAFFDGRRLHVNHAGMLSTVHVWQSVPGRANLMQDERGDVAPFPQDDAPARSSIGSNFVAPTPGDGGARNRYSNVGYSWNCAFVDTTQMTASVKPGGTGELGYAYEGGYSGISGNSYTTSTDAGLQIEPNHPPAPNIVAYLLEKPGINNPRKAITGGDFMFNAVFRVTAHVFVGTSGKTYVDTTVEGQKSDGTGVGTTDIALIADPAWNLAGTATVVKRITSIAQTIPGACGTSRTQCRLDGSFVKNVHWSDAYVGVNNGSIRTHWTASQGNQFLCVPNDSRVQVAYVNPAEETDSINLTTPLKAPCTQ